MFFFFKLEVKVKQQQAVKVSEKCRRNGLQEVQRSQRWGFGWEFACGKVRHLLGLFFSVQYRG